MTKKATKKKPPVAAAPKKTTKKKAAPKKKPAATRSYSTKRLDTKADVMKETGISSSTIHKWQARDDWPGLPISWNTLLAWMDENHLGPEYDPNTRAKGRQKASGPGRGRGGALSANDAYRLIKAKKEMLGLLVLEGDLIAMDAVKRLVSSHVNDARTLLETLPEAVGLLIADKELRLVVEEESRRIVNDALRTLAGTAKRLDEAKVGGFSVTGATAAADDGDDGEDD